MQHSNRRDNINSTARLRLPLIIVFDGNTEISTVEIELLLAYNDNITHKYHICVLLFITFDLICNVSYVSRYVKIDQFLADSTNGRAIATLLRLSSSVCDVMYCG